MKNKFLRKIVAPTSNTYGQLVRNVFVSFTAFGVDYGLMVLIVEMLNWHYLIAQLISNTIGGLVCYLLSVLWVFDKKPHKNVPLHFIYFTLIGIGGLGLNTLFMWLFTDIAGIYYMYSKLITAVLVFLFNFFVRKFLLFK